MVTDDGEFYEQQIPFPLAHLVDMALLAAVCQPLAESTLVMLVVMLVERVFLVSGAVKPLFSPKKK